MDQESRRVSLSWKIGGIFAGVLLLLGLFVLVTVYQLTQNVLRDQLQKQILLTANTLSDAAAGHIAGGNLLALHALARKYTLIDGVAFAAIENAKGEVVVDTLGDFPPELQRQISITPPRQISRRRLSLGGKPVVALAVPILEGQLGTVYLGYWGDTLESEIQRALKPLLAIMAVVPLVGVVISFLLAHRIVRPIAGLTAIADKVTMGDLETSVSGKCVKLRDEIGDLARSLERMRSSLKAAMMRLGRETV
ncbi:MAG TPA: HAMP domain-containing protein [Candidatus Binatia bacterium]|jgi:sensor histidine kinase regulating citrate/malate metabolism